MNKNFRIGAMSAAIMMAAGMGSVAHAADDADATASVEVLKPLTLTNDTGLDFAAVAVNGAGTAELGFDGSGAAADINCSTDLVCTGTASLAAFTVSDGSPGRTVTVDLPASGIDLVHQDPIDPVNIDANSETIELADFVTDADATNTLAADGVTVLSTTYSVDLGATGDADEGEASFQVGGTLTFDGSETAGDYEGTFNVSVEYS